MPAAMSSATVLFPRLHLLRPPSAEQRRREGPSVHPLQLQCAGRRRRGWIMGLLNSEAPAEAFVKQAGEIRREKQSVFDQRELHRKDDEQRDMMPQKIEAIRAMLKSMGDGEINISAYDTAWVALVKNLNGDPGPQFPSSINWIAQNQLSDGSWGDEAFFLVHDRMINTLACVVALKSWNIHADKCEKGLSFIRGNLWRLEDNELDDWMVCGFEITFPQLLEMANELGLNMPYDDPSLRDIYAKRDLKLTRIPKDVLHAVPTTLLLSIEGMPGLDWTRLLKLQCSDGSFMSSPAPTAYALMQTGDAKCLQFIDELVHKFNGGVPFTYPMDLFEHLWVVDRLERLGISRYFTSEIEACLEYVYRHWSAEGLPATRDAPVNDIDDTAMGFRLLRLHGYHVSPSVFRHFEKDGEFYCYPGQTNQSITAMYNLYRATQVAFPCEDDLTRAETYCREFLSDRRASNKLNDKWVIPKDLPGEVGYALDLPWKASLPRIETRMYLEQYGASSDVWIGKVLYRMHLVSNDLYLETAKADFTNFQSLCRLEWHDLKMWCRRKNLEMFGVTSKSPLRAYFLAAANIFEPDRAAERLGWARTAVLADVVSSHLRRCSDDGQLKEWFIAQLTAGNHCNNRGRRKDYSREKKSLLLNAIHDVINLLASDDRASFDCLRQAWKKWLTAWSSEDDEGSNAELALLLVRTVEICSGRHRGDDDDDFSRLEQLTSSICRKLQTRVHLLAQGLGSTEKIDCEVDLEMKGLAQLVLQNCSGTSIVTRQAFLHVVKSFYYVAHCSSETIDGHISKVIFEDVI